MNIKISFNLNLKFEILSRLASQVVLKVFTSFENNPGSASWVEKVQDDQDNYTGKHRRPFVLIYYEACLNEEDAKAREKYLKSGMGKRYLKNRMKNFYERNSKYQNNSKNQ